MFFFFAKPSFLKQDDSEEICRLFLFSSKNTAALNINLGLSSSKPCFVKSDPVVRHTIPYLFSYS